MKKFFLLLSLIFVVSTPVFADSAGMRSTASSVDAQTDAYINQRDSQQRLATDNYLEGSSWLILWNLFYAPGIAWLLIHFGLSRRMRDTGERWSRSVFATNDLSGAFFGNINMVSRI